MQSITYVSTVSSDMSEEEIKTLLQTSKEFNLEHGIHGIFMYSNGNFFQVIEGDSDTVRALYERIEKDSRHYNIIKLIDKTSNKKSFSNYSSSFTVIEDSHDVQKLYKFLKEEQSIDPEGFKRISYLTQKFLSLI